MEKKAKYEQPKRLTEAQWIVVCSLWERGEVTLKDLSQQFKISEAALSQGLKRRGIKRGAKAHESFKEIAEKIKEEKQKMIEDIYVFKKKFLKYGDFLMSLTMNEITDAKKNNQKLITKKNEIETIHSATKVYKTIRNDMFHLYGLYNEENNQPEQEEFNIGVYSPKELEQLREAQEIMDREMNASSNEMGQDFNRIYEGDDDEEEED